MGESTAGTIGKIEIYSKARKNMHLTIYKQISGTRFISTRFGDNSYICLSMSNRHEFNTLKYGY